MKVLQLAISGAMLVLLVGCSTLGADGKRIDYGSAATQVSTLEVPPDLTSPGSDERYKMPGDGGVAATYSDYSKGGAVQPRGAVLPEIPGVRMERDAAQRWLRIGDKPENVWPVVKAFWQANGLSIKSEDSAAGVMETDWAENRAKMRQTSFQNADETGFDSKLYSVGERDQYRTRLERGKDGASTEVYITHRGMEEVYSNDKKTSQWQARGNDPEKEAIMLQRLMVRFGVSETKAADAVAAVSAVAAATSAVPPASPAAASVPDPAGTASLREISGTTIIVVNDAFDRVWRKVGLAIESAGLAVEDKDREKGIYYLRPVKLESSWPEKMKFWKGNEDTRHYRVNVKDGGASCEVSITDQSGASNKTSKQMLEAMFKDINKQ